MAQSLNEDTARSQTPCSYEVQLLDVHWGTLMAENHIPRARLKAAKKSLHDRLVNLRASGGVAFIASSAQGSGLTVVPPARSAFAS